MTKKTNSELVDQQKSVLDWAYEGFKLDIVPRFLDFCKQEGKDQTEVISYTEYLVLKEKFEA